MAHRLTWRRFCSYTLIFGGFCFFIYSWVLPCDTANKSKMVPKDPIQYTYDAENHAFPYDKEMPLIFIGGVPRSGTTLMRAMLDAHPEVRCGEETRVIPRLLGMRTSWFKSEREAKRLREAGVNEEIVDSALGAFILEIIAKHGEPAQRLCNKDPFTLKSSIYLSQIFPNSKFVLMIRDGRAVVHSIISRHVTISGFDLKNFRQCLEKWNQAMETMYYQCLRVGAARCMPVYYEQLVLHPQTLSRKILEFLEIPWHDSVLHHDQFINKPGGVSLSKIERSTDQVIKPINLEALGKWASAVPEDVKKDIHQVAPMLGKLGYDPYAYPPNYGEADDIVHDNTLHIRRNEEEWRRKALEVKSYSKPNRPKHVGTPPRVEETVNHVDNRTVNPPANPPGGGTVVNPGVPSPQGDNGGAPR